MEFNGKNTSWLTWRPIFVIGGHETLETLSEMKSFYLVDTTSSIKENTSTHKLVMNYVVIEVRRDWRWKT